jgi:hypothetical protein
MMLVLISLSASAGTNTVVKIDAKTRLELYTLVLMSHKAEESQHPTQRCEKMQEILNRSEPITKQHPELVVGWLRVTLRKSKQMLLSSIEKPSIRKMDRFAMNRHGSNEHQVLAAN